MIRVGNFVNDQRPRFRPAPWRYVSLGGEMYVEPVGLDAAGSVLEAAIASGAETEAMGWQGYGYARAPLMIEDSQVGDGSDSLFGVHAFGLI
jgi:hypothetical protein